MSKGVHWTYQSFNLSILSLLACWLIREWRGGGDPCLSQWGRVPWSVVLVGVAGGPIGVQAAVTAYHDCKLCTMYVVVRASRDLSHALYAVKLSGMWGQGVGIESLVCGSQPLRRGKCLCGDNGLVHFHLPSSGGFSLLMAPS